jgi:putative ABC transport system permease protein
MALRLSWQTAGRIAFRETRASITKFLFVVLAVGAGVGALTGVRGFSQSFRSMLTSEARTVMAADLTARQFVMPDSAQAAALDQLAARGVDRTLITETVSMASSTSAGATPVLVSVKAVDPSKYPYYGSVKLIPDMPLVQALKPDTVAIGEDLAIRLGVKTGDPVRLGGQDFRVAALVNAEPDRMSGSLNIGLRLMMSREAFERTGLMQLGSRAAERILFKLSPGSPGVEEVRKLIKATLPESVVADFRQSHPIITIGLDRATTFLSLVSLIALIIGSIGVGMAMHAHLQQKMDHIAVMKSLGGTSTEIIRIFMLQTLMLGLLGGVVGALLGRLVAGAFPVLLSKLLPITAPQGWHVESVVQGITVGMLTTLLFTLPPLLAIRKVRPGLLLRRDMPETKPPLGERLRELKGSLASGAAILAGIGGIAAWLAESPKVGAYFAGGLFVSLLLLSAVAIGMLRGVRTFLKNSPWRLSSLARQGLANLYRPGNQAQAILVALGLGVMFTVSVYLVQKSLVSEIIQTAPPDTPNVYFIGVTQAQVEPLKQLIAKQDGVLNAPILAPSIAARLISVDGVALADRPVKGSGRRFMNTMSVMFAEEKPEDARIDEGSWWKKGEQEPVASIGDEVAKTLEIRLGSTIAMTSSGRTVRARVVAIHDTKEIRATPTAPLVFNPPALAGLPVTFYGGVRMKPSSVGAMQRAVFKEYPAITVVNIADALEIVQQVIDQIALVIRFLSAFAILAGAIILAASVAGTRFRRVREVVILKTLGGTRRQVQRIFSVEFLTLGAVAGLLGALLAAAFSNLILTRLLDARFQFDFRVTIACVILTALLSQISGWLASVRILRQKPLEVLREE